MNFAVRNSGKTHSQGDEKAGHQRMPGSVVISAFGLTSGSGVNQVLEKAHVAEQRAFANFHRNDDVGFRF
jgi:hypothetical protein